MLDRLILGVVLSTVGFHGLYPDPPPPLTLKQKAKAKSINKVCNKKHKPKELCEKWAMH